MPNAKHLFYQTEKTAKVFYKRLFLKILHYLRENTCENIQKHLLDDDELFLWYGWPTKGVPLFPARTIVRDPHHHESPTHRKQDLNLRRTWVQTLMNEVVQ